MARKSSVNALPDEVKHWLERVLLEGKHGFIELETLLKEQGYAISKSAIHRYGTKVVKRFEAIKASTEAARILTEGAPDDQDARSEAVIALVQSEIFETLISLQEAASAEDQKERISILSEAARNIATLTRASVSLKRYQHEIRDKLAAKLSALEAEASAGKSSLDLATVQRIAKDIYGIF